MSLTGWLLGPSWR